MKSRILVAVIGIPVLIWVILWAPVPVIAGILCVLAGIGGLELQQCVSGGKDVGLTALSVLLPVCTVAWSYWQPETIALLFMLETLCVFGGAIAQAGAWKFDQLTAALFGGICIGYSFAAFLRILATELARPYLFLPFLLSFACDTFAYFAGKTFGKHKLAPKVSPKKTIEGSIGGSIGNVVCGLLFAWGMDSWLNASIDYGMIMAMSFLCSIVAQMGDLSFSLIKREYGIKDYGHLFLEHGGVLDRFDSVLFVTPVVEMILRMTAVLW